MSRLFLGLLVAYKRFLSPLLPRSCRYTPTCSEYAMLVIRKYGLMRGGWLTVVRLARCNPLSAGGVHLP
jgi:putative membrane protein insertion efficiency factor